MAFILSKFSLALSQLLHIVLNHCQKLKKIKIFLLIVVIAFGLVMDLCEPVK